MALLKSAGVLCLSAFCFLGTACKTPGNSSSAKDTGIITTAPENQRATAFCWAYAIIAHLEQRYYEVTRGSDGGGFRLNLSEEYLGLIHLVNQLVEGAPTAEGRRLSQSLALIEKYGVVPEMVGERPLFHAKFDVGLGEQVGDRANLYWQQHGQTGLTPIPQDEALKIVASVAGLSETQQRFLAGAMGVGTAGDSEFIFANGKYTPQSFTKNRLKFSSSDYFVMTFPDTGRGRFAQAPHTAEYLQALGIVKKAMLYGYSVPISFNIFRGSKEEHGTLGCIEDGCWDAELSTPGPSSPHANHAVLLIDYRTAQSRFVPTSAEHLQQSFNDLPVEWVIKNSWGFNGNTSSNADLLKRYPLPAYTLLTQDFFETSHRLEPARYEAIVPRRVCLRQSIEGRPWTCEDLITVLAGGSQPGQETANLSLDTALIASNLNRRALSRYPVEYTSSAPEAVAGSDVLQLAEAAPESSPAGQRQVNLKQNTNVVGLDEAEFNLCTKVIVGPKTKYVALFFSADDQSVPESTPKVILNEQNNWQNCSKVANQPGEFLIVLQAIDSRFKTTSQIRTTVRISSGQ